MLIYFISDNESGEILNEILFFLFAFLTVYLSIKLSFYSDLLSKTSNVSKAFIGGILLAGITSLPEFVTCLSAIIFDNPSLAMGDILGSNLFNIFMICFFDIIFIKKMMFTKTNKNHFIVYLLLIINYGFIYLFVNNLFTSKILNIGIPSIVIIVTYLYYLSSLAKREEEKEELIVKKVKYLVPKIVLTALLMVISSTLLTVTVNNIAISHPHFSSSLIGAILLGVTTSLPEVITFYTLVKLNSYDLALANIIGSNLFNLLVLAVGDVILIGSSIYEFADTESLVILKLGIVVTLINLLQNMRKKSVNKFFYVIFSIIVVLIYLSFWFINFVC